MKQGEAARRPPHTVSITLTDDPPSITERPFSVQDHRERQVRRLAVIAQVRAAYGSRADARLVPPGPDVCPPWCPYCYRPAGAVAS